MWVRGLLRMTIRVIWVQVLLETWVDGYIPWDETIVCTQNLGLDIEVCGLWTRCLGSNITAWCDIGLGVDTCIYCVYFGHQTLQQTLGGADDGYAILGGVLEMTICEGGFCWWMYALSGFGCYRRLCVEGCIPWDETIVWTHNLGSDILVCGRAVFYFLLIWIEVLGDPSRFFYLLWGFAAALRNRPRSGWLLKNSQPLNICFGYYGSHTQQI